MCARAFVLGVGLMAGVVLGADIEPTWESMAAQYQVPEWFVNGKLGVWMHWGISSAIDESRPHDGSHYGRRMYGTKDYWTPSKNPADVKMTEVLTEWHTQRYGHPSEFGYEDLVPLFKAEKWDPDALTKLVKECGARFIMPVACHHDNFDMYDSSFPWNAAAMGPKRDTIQEWKDAAQKYGLKFGVSTHLYWSPRFFSAARKYQKPGTPAWKLFSMDYEPLKFASQDSWNEHWYARCWELIEKYDPDMFNNDSPYPSLRTGKGLGLKLFSDYVNRDLQENGGKQTVVLSFKDSKKDRGAFTYNLERGSSGEIQSEPWMWATDLSGNWFYRKGAVNHMSIPVTVGNAVDAISKNGVVMLNIALRGDGTIPENQLAYLTAIGNFLKVNGEGIYDTRPWQVFGEGPLEIKTGRQGENRKPYSQDDIRFTAKADTLYAFVLAPPTRDIVIKTLATGGVYAGKIGSISLLGSEESLTWTRTADGLTIKRPKTHTDQLALGIRITPAKAVEETLAEDPSTMAHQVNDQSDEKPWLGKTPEELRKWAQKNLHRKLTARKVIDAEVHPEWEWFRKSGLGLFLHWGPAGVAPNNGDAWAMVWSKQKEKAKRTMILPEAAFAVAETWNPENYQPDKWMEAAGKAGFGYAVLTTRHHDGYCLWPSEHGSWDTGDHMKGRDLVKGYVAACRKHGLRVGFYYSGPNWHYDYKNKGFSWPPAGIDYRHESVQSDPPLAGLMGYTPPLPDDGDRLEQEESSGQVRELMTNYGPIDIMWWDGNSIMSPEELAELQPNIFVARGLIATPEGAHQGASKNVKVANEAGWWWESCQKSENTHTPYWHYGAECETNHWDANKLLTELVRCRSLGGNLLVNVPPRGNGEMMDWYYEICTEMAGWMAHSREATYDVDLAPPLPTLDKTQNFTTVKGSTWYSMANDRDVVLISDVGQPSSVTLLGTSAALASDYGDRTLRVVVPPAMRTALPDMVKIVFGE